MNQTTELRLQRHAQSKRIQSLLPSGLSILAGALLAIGGGEKLAPYAGAFAAVGIAQGALVGMAGTDDERFFEREVQSIVGPEIAELKGEIRRLEQERDTLTDDLTEASADASAARQEASELAEQTVALERSKYQLEQARLSARIDQLTAELQTLRERPQGAMEQLTDDIRSIIRGWIQSDLQEQLERAVKVGSPSVGARLHPELLAWRQQRINTHWERRLSATRQRLADALEQLDQIDDTDDDSEVEALLNFALNLADAFRLDIQKLYSCGAIANSGEVQVLSRRCAQAEADKQSAIELASEYREQLEDLDRDMDAVSTQVETVGQEYRSNLEALVTQTEAISRPRTYGTDAIHDHQRLSDWFALSVAKDGVKLDRLHSSRTARGIQLRFNYVGRDWTGAKTRIQSAADVLQSQATAIQVPDIRFNADETVTIGLVQLPPDPNVPVEWPSWVGTADKLMSLCLSYCNVRISGGTGAGKSPLATCISVAAVRSGRWEKIVLANPVSGLGKDDWPIPARHRTEAEILESLKALDRAIGGDGMLESESRVVIWDELNKALKSDRDAQKALDSAMKTVSHLGELHLWLGQNPNVSASGQQNQDRSNYLNVVIGHAATVQLLKPDKAGLAKTDEIQRLADHENRRLRLDKTASEFTRWCYCESPDGHREFFLMPAFTPENIEVTPDRFDNKAPEFRIYRAAHEQGQMKEWVTARKDKRFQFQNQKARTMATQLLSCGRNQEKQPEQVTAKPAGPFPGKACPYCGNANLSKLSDGRASCKKSFGGCGKRIQAKNLV